MSLSGQLVIDLSYQSSRHPPGHVRLVLPSASGPGGMVAIWPLAQFVVLDIRRYRRDVPVPFLRLTKPTLAVLDVLAQAAPDDDVWGLRICEEADLGPGTVYPILERLAAAGWLDSYWEDGQPSGRPRRRFHQLTGVGRVGLGEALAARATRRRRLGFAVAPSHGGPA